MKNKVLIISCEHGGNYVPQPFSALFESKKEILHTHRGFDSGSLELGILIAETFGVFPIVNPYTRLLIDCNRSPGNASLFSEFTQSLDDKRKQQLIKLIYHPYRDKIQQLVHHAVSEKHQVMHISMHSFTPELNGQVRTTDIGLLYDPSRSSELTFCKNWHKELQKLNTHQFQIDHNLPYQGIEDGLTTYLRSHFSSSEYIGVEIEINQKWVESTLFPQMNEMVVDSLKSFF